MNTMKHCKCCRQILRTAYRDNARRADPISTRDWINAWYEWFLWAKIMWVKNKLSNVGYFLAGGGAIILGLAALWLLFPGLYHLGTFVSGLTGWCEDAKRTINPGGMASGYTMACWFLGLGLTLGPIVCTLLGRYVVNRIKFRRTAKIARVF